MAIRIDKEVDTQIVTITPELAKKWLEANHINRNLKARQVADLANVIKAGQWDELNGETIIISSNGDLLDGQHRLNAVVKANMPIVSLVVFNVDPSKRGSIDVGFKRTFGDFLAMHGESNANALAAGCHVLHGYEEKTLRSLARGMPFISYEEGRTFLNEHPYLHKALPLIQSMRHLVPPAWGIALFSLFLQKDVLLAEEYASILSRGESTEKYPILRRVRERLIRNGITQAKLPHLTLGVYIVKAWNATRKHEVLKVFKFTKDEEFPTVV